MIYPAAWATPFRRISVGTPEMVALASAYELFKESRCMNRCADKLADRCAKGGLLIVSIRKAGRTRPLVAAALRRDEGLW